MIDYNDTGLLTHIPFICKRIECRRNARLFGRHDFKLYRFNTKNTYGVITMSNPDNFSMEKMKAGIQQSQEPVLSV